METFIGILLIVLALLEIIWFTYTVSRNLKLGS